MSNKKERLDVQGETKPLTDNPFAQLAQQIPDDLPKQNQPKPAAEVHAEILPAYQIGRTKKGGFPVSLEKRASGKKVTVLRNVTGDIQGLLKTLKKHCGAGGIVRDDTLEIQGDQRERIETFLKQDVR